MGIRDAHLDEHGYVYATIPANTDKQVPVICFCSHMDTSPDCTGNDVKPQIVRNYRGGDIVLPADPTQIIRAAEHPALADQIGNDIVTSDGTTLLAPTTRPASPNHGCRAFPDSQPADQARHHQDPVHARRRDRPRRRQGRPEKARRRFRLYDRRRNRGNIEDETFSADGAVITIEGVSTHPGFAKGKMEHAIKIAAAIVDRLPKIPARPKPPRASRAFCIRSAFPARWKRPRSVSSCAISPMRVEGERSAAGEYRQGRDEGLSALDLPARDQAAIPQHESR